MSAAKPSWLTPGAMVTFAYACDHGVYVRNTGRVARTRWKLFRPIAIGEVAMIIECLVGWPDKWTNSVTLLMHCGTVIILCDEAKAAWLLGPL